MVEIRIFPLITGSGHYEKIFSPALFKKYYEDGIMQVDIILPQGSSVLDFAADDCEVTEQVAMADGRMAVTLDVPINNGQLHLPEGTEILGDLDIAQEPEVTTLRGLVIGGNLIANGSQLQSVLRLIIKGDFIARNCQDLWLVKEVKVEGNLDLRWCRKLKSLPADDSSKIGGCLLLVGSTIHTVPAHWHGGHDTQYHDDIWSSSYDNDGIIVEAEDADPKDVMLLSEAA